MTRFLATDHHTCELTADWDDGWGGATRRETRSYWAPRAGGYVRDVTKNPGTLGMQVGPLLANSGNMLHWEPRDGPLVNLIRREWRRLRAWERREARS